MEFIEMQKISHSEFLKLIKGKTLAFMVCSSHGEEEHKKYIPKLNKEYALADNNYINIGKVIKVGKDYFKREYKCNVGGYDITACYLKNNCTNKLDNLLVVITERKQLLYKIMD